MASVLRTFKGLEHRLELIREVNGVAYYDDSFSTTPETALEEGIGATGTDDSNLITPAIVNDSPILNNIAGVLQFADYMVSKYMYHPVYGRKAGSINPDTNQ